jgi:hypothetical protein
MNSISLIVKVELLFPARMADFTPIVNSSSQIVRFNYFIVMLASLLGNDSEKLPVIAR